MPSPTTSYSAFSSWFQTNIITKKETILLGPENSHDLTFQIFQQALRKNFLFVLPTRDFWSVAVFFSVINFLYIRVCC